MRRLALLTLLAALAAGSRASAAEVLPFIEDDYSKAVAQAKARNVPIFVETWAPW